MDWSEDIIDELGEENVSEKAEDPTEDDIEYNDPAVNGVEDTADDPSEDVLE